MDNWDRKTNFNCESCMFYVPKKEHSSAGNEKAEYEYTDNPKELLDAYSPVEKGRCRCKSPTMKGYPVVFADDWCGEHKIGSNPLRDADKPKSDFGSDFATETKFCTKCKEIWATHIKKEFVQEYFPQETCPRCKDKPLTKEDVRKVLDEPLDRPRSVPEHPLTSSPLGYNIANETKCNVEVRGNTIRIVELEEKAKIKEEIVIQLDEMICTDKENNYSHSERQYLRKVSTEAIKELLEKL